MKTITGLLIIGLSLVLSCTKESASSVNKIEDLYTVPADAVTMPALSDPVVHPITLHAAVPALTPHPSSHIISY